MMLPACPIRRSGQPSPQHGMTLIELMVAMALGLLIVLAAAASLLFAREGFTAVDAASQLRDNGRFLQNLVLRLGAQTGYKNLRFATETKRLGDAPGNALAPPDIFGVNNAKRGTQSEWDSGTERQSGEVGYGSDILVLRYQTSSATADSATSDKTMIDCAGVAATNVPTEPGDKLVSILYVKEDSAGAEPALMCARSETGAAPYDAQPIISGVENFQVLYGVDGIGPANTAVPGTTDRVVDRYLRADQLTVSGSQPASINKAATYANWRRVRSIRIGVVLRGPPGSAKPDGGNQTFYPLGITKDSASGTEGAAFSSSNDPGSIYTPPFDGRLRQTLTFTVHLRNAQDEN
ncbi:prepilin-type N-terminal cleavage/methylation domain-containing protein [Verminephrobacter eiseniae]|nr:prepilin-type N-terminal cleavage/methylation domain-containing protein [Verminephrobacter eiseniae]